MPAPSVISVVVATHQRRHLLPRLLCALGSQQDVGQFEVVIVDDGSTDGTWKLLHQLASDAKFPLRLERLARNSGPAVARNVGWRQAEAPLIAFTDDDCIPQPGWLAALVHHLGEYDIVQGRTMPIPEQHDRLRPFARYIKVESEWGYYETCNIGYRRSALERAGGFDERFRQASGRPGRPPIHGEDVDLAWRLKEVGMRSTFAPEALVYHEVWTPSYRAFLRDKLRKDGLVYALKRHPTFRRQRGVFQNGSHPAALAFVGSSALFVTRPRLDTFVLCVALGATYKKYCERHNRRPRRRHLAHTLPLYLLADLLEIAVLARSSLRYRTLVL